jgi:hypothetical protein
VIELTSLPASLAGPFCVYVGGNLSAGSFLVPLGRADANGDTLYINDGQVGLTSFSTGTQSADQQRIPPGDFALRCRRDADDKVYFAWNGQAEFQAIGPPYPTTGTFVFDVIGASRGEESTGPLDVLSHGASISTLKIIDGDTTPAERAAIETELFGFTL